MDNYSHSEVWLELNTPDVEQATQYLASRNVNTCDELEEIPAGAHWIQDPAGTVFIVNKSGQ